MPGWQNRETFNITLELLKTSSTYMEIMGNFCRYIGSNKTYLDFRRYHLVTNKYYYFRGNAN